MSRPNHAIRASRHSSDLINSVASRYIPIAEYSCQSHDVSTSMLGFFFKPVTRHHLASMMRIPVAACSGTGKAATVTSAFFAW